MNQSSIKNRLIYAVIRHDAINLRTLRNLRCTFSDFGKMCIFVIYT